MLQKKWRTQHTHTHTLLDKTYSTFCAKFMTKNVPCKFETTAFQRQKEGNHNTVSSPWTCSAGTRRWSIFASPPVTSFVRQGHHWRPCPPAMNETWYKFYVYWDGPHTHPAKAGFVQYASYTTKCPGTTSGLSGKQATHDGVQALPPVGTGPAHKKFCQTRGMA